MWVFLAIFVLTFALFAFAPKVQSQKPPGVNELTAPTAEVGRAIPVLFGTRDINSANVVWYGDVRILPVKKSGGKK